MNTQCNAIENTIFLEEAKGKSGRLEDYADMFITMKQMLAGFVSVTFDDLNYAKREIDHYQDEFVKRGSNADDWRADVITALAEWDETGSTSKEKIDPNKKLYVPEFDENGVAKDTPLSSTPTDTLEKKNVSKLNKNSFLEEFKPTKDTPKGFKDVAGMEKLKKDLQENIIEYINNPEQAKIDKEEYGKEMPHAILLYGPPGCGKTYITHALSQEANSPLYLLNISKAGSSYINMTSQNIKNAFDEVIAISEKQDKPCLVFMDEIDTLGFNRGTNVEPEDLKQVGTILQSIDNAKNANIILIGATNKYDILDPAIRRRFDSKILVGLPDEESRKALIKKNLTPLSKGQVLLQNEEEIEKIAKQLDGYTNSSICNISKQASLNALQRGRADISLEDYEKAIKETTEEKPNPKQYEPESTKKPKKIGF